MSEKESGITEWGMTESGITESVITELGITGKQELDKMGKSGIMLSEQKENSFNDPRRLNMLNVSENYMVVISYPYQGTGGITYKHLIYGHYPKTNISYQRTYKYLIYGLFPNQSTQVQPIDCHFTKFIISYQGAPGTSKMPITWSFPQNLHQEPGVATQ